MSVTKPTVGQEGWGETLNDALDAVVDRANHTGSQISSTISDFSAAADARISAQKATANGLASLDPNGKLLTSQLSALALTDVNSVVSQAAQLALSAQEGDVAIRTDLNQTFIHNGGTANTMADWTMLSTPTDAVSSVASRTGAVTLTKSDVGLSNVDNTSDVSKPVSTAQAAADTAAKARANHTGTQTASTISDFEAAVVAASPPAAVTSVASRTGAVTLIKSDVGLANVDNTADASKPVSTAQQAAVDAASTTSRARANHTGTQSADTLTDGTTNHVFTAADDTKLTGIATGATANNADAVLLARANHTGTQLAATISDFNAAAIAAIPAGAAGTQWFVGSGAPTTVSGSVVGDKYLDTTSGIVYILS